MGNRGSVAQRFLFCIGDVLVQISFLLLLAVACSIGSCRATRRCHELLSPCILHHLIMSLCFFSNAENDRLATEYDELRVSYKKLAAKEEATRKRMEVEDVERKALKAQRDVRALLYPHRVCRFYGSHYISHQ